MDPRLQSIILERLAALKATERVSEYLVSWTGAGGQLTPSVTVWPGESSDPALLSQVAQLLTDLVPEGNIVVATE